MRTLPILVAACLLVVTSARAATTIVPDNYATIQAALDANMDTIWVKSGTYNETVSITRGVLLAPWSSYYTVAEPIVLRLVGTVPYGGSRVTVQGFHILRSASLASPSGGCQVISCRVDSGLTVSSAGFTLVTGCTVFGSLIAAGANAAVHLNTVISGTLRVQSNAGQCTLDGNYVSGASGAGLSFGEDCYATDNLVRNCGTGISFGSSCCSAANGNVVEDCGAGIVSGYPGLHFENWTSCQNNTVRRCSGVGIAVYGNSPTIDGNTVDSTGSTGMYLPVMTDHLDNNTVTRANGVGILAQFIGSRIHGNAALHCASHGIQVDHANLVDHNVTGHNGGAGVMVTSDNETRLRSNTSFDNLGAGFSLVSDNALPDSVSNNIGYGNGVGLQRNGLGSIELACNDWFGNITATSGVTPGATDFALDPLFCNAPADVVTLATTSPALNRAGCGLVGALAQGCTVAATVEERQDSHAPSLRAYPQPGHAAMRFAWRPLAGGAHFEVFDAQGAQRFSRDVAAGEHELSWSRVDTQGRSLPPGIYFARLRCGERELGTCRVVVLD